MFFVVLFFSVLFYVSISNEKRIIKEELLEESDLNIIPRHHIEILTSSTRLKKGWINEQIRKEYIRSAIKLAFRKMQFKGNDPYKSEIYAGEINKYRERVIKLLNSATNSNIN